MDGLVRQLRARLDHIAEQFPGAAVLSARNTVEAIYGRIGPELDDSDNDHARMARDMLSLVLDELHASDTAFGHAHTATVDYAASR